MFTRGVPHAGGVTAALTALTVHKAGGGCGKCHGGRVLESVEEHRKLVREGLKEKERRQVGEARKRVGLACAARVL